MNWLESREEKEKEQTDVKTTHKKEQQQLFDQGVQINEEFKLLSDKIIRLGSEAHKKIHHLFLNDEADPRQLITQSLADINNISSVENSGDYPYDLVESFFLFWSMMRISLGGVPSIHNKYNQTIMVRNCNTYKFYLNDFIAKAFWEITNSFIKKLFGGAIPIQFALNRNADINQIKPIEQKKVGYRFQMENGIFWDSTNSTLNQNDIFKMKSALEDIKNDKVIKFHLWMTDKQFRDKCSVTPEYIYEIKKAIFNEKKEYNERILKLFDADDIENVKKTLMPNILNSYRLLTETHRIPLSYNRESLIPSNINLNDWNSLQPSIISSLIVIDSISKINGYHKSDENVPDNKFMKESLKKRVYATPPWSYDHIYIDGVGWMHEDEVGHDRN